MMHILQPLAVVLLATHGGDPGSDAVIRKWLGDYAVGVLESADRLDAKAVRNKPASAKLKASEKIVEPGRGQAESMMGFPVYASADSRLGNFARRLRDILLDSRTYSVIGSPRGNFIKGCAFSPDVGLRVWSPGGDHLDLLISFSCDQVEVEVSKSADDKGRVVVGDVEPGRQKLVQLVKEILPEVAEIRQISEKRNSHKRGKEK